MRLQITAKDASVNFHFTWKERIRIFFFGRLKFNAEAFRHLMNILQHFFYAHLDLLEKHPDENIRKIYNKVTRPDATGVDSK